jgi:hypothetical protein
MDTPCSSGSQTGNKLKKTHNAAAETGLFATLRVAKIYLHKPSTLGPKLEVVTLFSLAICGPFFPTMYQSATK